MTTRGSGMRFDAIFDGSAVVGLGAAQLLTRFAATRDEAAFAALVAHHGPMVLATCRRILPERADADDAFQATFLVLARKARSIGDPDRLAPWLHGVARRVAVRARSQAARRLAVEADGDEPADVAVAPPPDDTFELRAILDDELARLPAKYRDPLVLCYLEGLTQDEAARQLAWPLGTVRSRLAGGRDRLRSRLARRGFAPGSLVVLAPTSLPVPVVSRILQAATVRLVCAGGSGAVATSAAAVLAQGVLTAMFFTKIQTAAVASLALAIACAGTAGVVAQQQPAAAATPAPATATAPASEPTATEAPMPAVAFDPGETRRTAAITFTPGMAFTPTQPTPVNPARPAGALPETLELAIRALAQDLTAAKARIDTLEAGMRALRAEVRSTRVQAGEKISESGPAMMNGQAGMMLSMMDEAKRAGQQPPDDQQGLTSSMMSKRGRVGSALTNDQPGAISVLKPAGRAEPKPLTRSLTGRANSDSDADDPGVSRIASRPLATGGGNSDDGGPTTRTTPGPAATRSRPTGIMSMALPGSNKLLVIPAERNQATVIDTGTNQRLTYRDPEGSKIMPLIGGNVVGLELQGPHITQAVAFSRTANQWYPLDLKEGPADELLNPIVSENEVRYYLGRNLYFFNDLHKRWSTLTLKQPIRKNTSSAPGERHEGSKTMIPEGDTMHIYDSQTGEWTHINLKDE